MKKDNVMDVRELHEDHVLDESDNGCMLYFTAQANLMLEPDSCPVGFMCYVICAAEMGMVNPGRSGGPSGADIMVNGQTGPRAMRYFGSGVNILAQPAINDWTLGNAQAG